MAAGVSDQGNFALCHWLYYKGQGGLVAANPNESYYAKDGAAGVNWGETRFYNAYEWGNSGSHITGANIQTGGTAVGGGQGFALSHTNLLTYTAGVIYSMSWYQPKYSETGYASNALRRYSGGNFGTRADKVKAFSVGNRLLTDATVHGIYAADQTGSSGTVSLSSAVALAASLSFGMATLAF